MISPSPGLKTILFLASDPDGLRQVGKELRDIKEGLQRSQYRDQFFLLPCLDVRPRDIQRSLLDEKPTIVHFAGTGTGETGLIFVDEVGNPKLVDGAALAGLFELFVGDIHCVVLNGCYSEVQAKAIAQHIPYVVGMRAAVSAEVAIAFAVGFYDALGAGRGIKFAFELGGNAIQMQGLAEHLTPVLVQKSEGQTEPDRSTTVTEISVKLWGVPGLPPHFLARPETLNALKAQVLNNLAQPVVMTSQGQRIGVQGMGGLGKSVLATALAYDEQVQTAFPDGIYWLTVGIEPNLLTLQADLAEALSGDRLVFEDLNQGKNRLKALWQGRRGLLILDDVWRIAAAEAFNVLGDQSALVITTRDGELITGLGATNFSLDVLNDAQAMELLAAWVGVEISALPMAAMTVAEECGNLPLALVQCGAMVRDFTPWQDILSDLQGGELAAIEKQFSHYPDASVFKALHKSTLVLAETNPIAAERYQELAVFPADALIPEAVVVRLWQYTGGLTDKDARKILATLARKGMLRLESDYPQRRVSLHDLQQDYLQAQVADRPGLHEQLLAAYEASCPDGWHTGLEDGYFFEHLTYHLLLSKRQNELRSLLVDFRWIYSKLSATNINGVLADYEHLQDDTELRLVQSALRLSAHILNRHPEQLQSQLHGRLISVNGPGIEALMQQIVQSKKDPWLRFLWPCLAQAGGPLLRTLTGHTEYVWSVAASPDGAYILSASWDKTVKMWELKTGREVLTLTHTEYVHGVTVSPNGTYILSACGNISENGENAVNVWELKTGRKVFTLMGHTAYVSEVTMSPDGTYILSASADGTVKIWDLKTGQEVRTLVGHEGRVESLTVSPDGTYILSASADGTVKIWDLKTGQEVRTLVGHEVTVYSVAISPDGVYVVSASGDSTVKVWELNSGCEVYTLTGHTKVVTDVMVTPDGEHILSASTDHTVKVWNLKTGQEVRTLIGHTEAVRSVTVSPDGAYVLSVSNDRTLKVWDMQIGREMHPLKGHTHPIAGVMVSSDGVYAVSTSYGDFHQTVKMWELQTGNEVCHLTHESYSYIDTATVSPDGVYGISAYKSFSPFGDSDYPVKVWELKIGQEKCSLAAQKSSVGEVTMSPGGTYILSGSADGTVKVYEIERGQEVFVLTGHRGRVEVVNMSPDGNYILSGSADGTVKIWDLKTGQEVRTLIGHTGRVESLTVSPDGTYVISGCSDSIVKVWDLRTGQEIRTLIGHTAPVYGVAISLDSTYILSSSRDETMKIWEMKTGREVMSFVGEHSFSNCVIAPDGRTVIAGDSGGQLYFLRLEGPKFLDSWEATP